MRSVRNMTSLLLLIFSATASANVFITPQNKYYPTEFYQAVEGGIRDADLKLKLFTILSQVHVTGTDHDVVKEKCGVKDACYKHTTLGYTRAREIMFGQIHLVKTPDGYGVLDVYCQHLTTTKDFRRDPPGPGQIPDGAIINAEHTWPQSHFSGRFDRDIQKSDLHILYPVLQNANSSRSNLKFGDVTSTLKEPCAGAKRGYSSNGTGEIYFEVPSMHKGNAARAIFYFSVRYKLAITAEEEASLKAWHRLDPVDDFERQRNEVAFTAQHDRNPFIDHPELVELISDF